MWYLKKGEKYQKSGFLNVGITCNVSAEKASKAYKSVIRCILKCIYTLYKYHYTGIPSSNTWESHTLFELPGQFFKSRFCRVALLRYINNKVTSIWEEQKKQIYVPKGDTNEYKWHLSLQAWGINQVWINIEGRLPFFTLS